MRPGSRFGRFEIVYSVDESAYIAWDHAANRQVALQLIAGDPTKPGRFRHPNLPRLIDTGFEGGQAYVVMEVVTGDHASLTRFDKELVKLEVERCVSDLHRNGLAHERLFLDNVVIRDGHIVLRWPKFSTNIQKDRVQLKALRAAVDQSEKSHATEGPIAELNGTPASDRRTDVFAITLICLLLEGLSYYIVTRN
jgi:hypothetical protein